MNCVFFAGCISMSFYRPYSNTNINNNNDNNNNDDNNNNNNNNDNNNNNGLLTVYPPSGSYLHL